MKNLLKIFLLGGLFFLSSTQIIFADSLKINLDDAINFALKNNIEPNMVEWDKISENIRSYVSAG